MRMRGSSFGRFTTPQPSQINFENKLAWALIQHAHQGHRHVVLEDEGRNVGDRQIPKPLVEHYRTGQLVILERTLEERVQITYDEYITNSQSAYIDLYGIDAGKQRWMRHMDGCIDRIRKRLGGLRYQTAKELLRSGQHKEWIEQLLAEYYDPMYDYQIQNKSAVIAFKGNASEVLEYLKSLN